ncbi:DUF1758 and DUF1759 domain containing protein [Daphnia sinensis]|uniref:DUF1758 and DUF1759 domain containing protein n=1 Tax=Daphnia sinensis TaxID=1820382 RepID=A0AAD5LD64_9CRUS|nr:DUF1758 and DUF1759 domain containing protein [Daphnia sinensis]
MAARKLNEATLAVDVLENELHKDLKNYEEASRDDRWDDAETAYELADDRMKRLIKNYELIIPLLNAPEAQQKYLVQHEEFVNRFHKIKIDWRKNKPAVQMRSTGTPTLKIAAPNGTIAPPSGNIAPPKTAIAQPMIPMQLQVASGPMSVAHILPRIEITKFDGDLHKWKDWWEIFRTLIHEDQSMRPIEKFSRLKLHLTEEAAGAISYLDLTDNNYSKAIDILTGKFNKPKSVKADHYIAITELPRVERQDDFKELRKLHDKAMGHALNLGNLDQTSAQNEAIMEILTRKLPLELISRWHSKTRQNIMTLEDFFKFINSIAEDWEYAYSTEKQEKKKTKSETSEKTQRVNFATTPTAAELAVTGTATVYEKEKKQSTVVKRKC